MDWQKFLDWSCKPAIIIEIDDGIEEQTSIRDDRQSNQLPHYKKQRVIEAQCNLIE